MKATVNEEIGVEQPEQSSSPMSVKYLITPASLRKPSKRRERMLYHINQSFDCTGSNNEGPIVEPNSKTFHLKFRDDNQRSSYKITKKSRALYSSSNGHVDAN